VTLEPPFDAIDRGGMAARIEAIPDQIEQQLERLHGFRWQLPAAPEWLAVGAMGGSAIAAAASFHSRAGSSTQPSASSRCVVVTQPA